MTHRVAAEAFAAGAAILPESGARNEPVEVVDYDPERPGRYTDAKGPFIVEQLNRAEGWAVEIGWLP